MDLETLKQPHVGLCGSTIVLILSSAEHEEPGSNLRIGLHQVSCVRGQLNSTSAKSFTSLIVAERSSTAAIHYTVRSSNRVEIPQDRYQQTVFCPYLGLSSLIRLSRSIRYPVPK
jgi:hypothetical protein